MKRLSITLVILGFLALQGCAAIALTAGSMGAGQGLDHTMSGTVYKTFTMSVDDMQTATFETLDRMDMAVTDTRETDAGWEITAEARDRTIEIELEALTSRTTRMKVTANRGEIFFKDSATATEIIIQTAQMVEDLEIRSASGRNPDTAKR